MAVFAWTGNPVVDTGLAVAVVRANKKSPGELTLSDFQRVIGDGKWLADANEVLNAYGCLFANGFLNHQVKAKDKPAQRVKYQKIINGLCEDLQESFSKEMSGINLCECTGIFPSANKKLAALTKQFQKDRILKKNQRLDVGRNAFPLIGSITNDAGALPAASREPQVSAFALLCAQMASLGAVMLKGKIAFFQYTEPDLLISHVKAIHDETAGKVDITRRIDGENMSISAIGAGTGSKASALLLLNEFHRLKGTQEIKQLPDSLALNLWLIINSGTSFDCELVEIPNQALSFLWEAATQFPDEIKSLIRKDGTESILDCIIQKKDYNRLYPVPKSKPIPVELIYQARATIKEFASANEFLEENEKDNLDELTQATIDHGGIKEKSTKQQRSNRKAAKGPVSILNILSKEYKTNNSTRIKQLIEQITKKTSMPSSRELFALYQTKIIGVSDKALAVAEWLSYLLQKTLRDKKNEKQLVTLMQHLGDVTDVKACRPLIRELLAEFAEDGSLTYDQYLTLFPVISRRPVRTNNRGWAYLWFYLNHDQLNDRSPQLAEEDVMLIDNWFRQQIKAFARDVFDWYTERHGVGKFKKTILDGFLGEKIRDTDLQRWFCNLAELSGRERYTNETWDELCRDEDGRNRTYEIRFQLRLELANLYRQAISNK